MGNQWCCSNDNQTISNNEYQNSKNHNNLTLDQLTTSTETHQYTQSVNPHSRDHITLSDFFCIRTIRDGYKQNWQLLQVELMKNKDKYIQNALLAKTPLNYNNKHTYVMRVWKKDYLSQSSSTLEMISYRRRILNKLNADPNTAKYSNINNENINPYHPFINHLKYSFQTRSHIFMLFDYCQGEELFFHLKKRRRFNENEAKIMIGEIILAIGYLHSIGIEFRELIPEHILIDAKGHIQLFNFKFSKDIDQEPFSIYEDASIGQSPEYMSPEMVSNVIDDKKFNKDIDWWCVGLLLYELVVGSPPFWSHNYNQMYRNILEKEILYPRNLTNECKDLINKLLIRDPKNRLGFGENDVKDVQKHIFFNDIDWNLLYHKKIEPIYKPTTLTTDVTKYVSKYHSYQDKYLISNMFDINLNIDVNCKPLKQDVTATDEADHDVELSEEKFKDFYNFQFKSNSIDWECERIIWIGFNKNLSNIKCFFAKIPKDLVLLVLSFLKLL